MPFTHIFISSFKPKYFGVNFLVFRDGQVIPGRTRSEAELGKSVWETSDFDGLPQEQRTSNVGKKEETAEDTQSWQQNGEV